MVQENGSCPDLFAGNHLLTAHAKTCKQMLRHRQSSLWGQLWSGMSIAHYLMQSEGCAS